MTHKCNDSDASTSKKQLVLIGLTLTLTVMEGRSWCTK